MVDFLAEFIKTLLILFPAYAANGFPPLAKGKRPIDMNRKWRGNRIFGDGKTIEGFALGLFIGFLVGALESYLYFDMNVHAMLYGGFSLPLINLFIGFMISLGALCGDLGGSFIKRRLKLKRGADVPLLDQWNFIIGAVLFAMWFTEITVIMLVLMLIITPVVHRIANIVAHRLKIKREPW